MIVSNVDNKPITRYVKKGDKDILQYLVNNKTWIDKDKLITSVKAHLVANAKIHGSGISIIKPETKIERVSSDNIDKLYRLSKYLLATTYDYSYTYQNFVERYEKNKKDCLKNHGYIVFFGNKIMSWFGISETLGVLILIPLYYVNKNALDESISRLSKLYPDIVIRYSDYGTNPPLYKYIDRKSSINSDYEYCISHGIYITRGNERILTDKIEEEYFVKDIDINKLSLKCINGTELYDLWMSNYFKGYFEGYWINSCNIYSVVGFHYFRLDDSKKDAKYILAYYDNKIVGVIKLGVYNGDHQAIAFIDVLETSRNQGVATYMIKNIDQFLDKSLPLMITDESDMGKMCHIADKFKTYVKSVKVKTYEEALKDGRYD